MASDSLVGPHHRLRLRAPPIAAAARPGQFLHCLTQPLDGPLQAGGPPALLLRRPFSIARIAGPDVEIVFRIIGQGTQRLAGARPGQRVDLLGPLGRGFEVPQETDRVLLVGGGMGAAPLFALAELVMTRRIRSFFLVGARDDESFAFRAVRGDGPARVAEISALGMPNLLVTEAADGLLVTEYLAREAEALLGGAARPQLYAVGPAPMLAAMARLAAGRWPLQVSLEQRMACGLGACRSCVIPARAESGRAYRTVCHDGPVFDAEEILWDELVRSDGI